MLWRFDNVELDTARRELRRAGVPVAVEPQVFDLLVHLVENRERVVTRDELLEAIWGGRIVSESALSTRINAARVAVGDSGDEQRCIKTFPRKGFRFVAELSDALPPESPAPVAAAPPPQADAGSIAVLPFVAIGSVPEDEHLADGLTEDIITALSRQPDLHVAPRNSSFALKGRMLPVREAAAVLGVRFLLEGSLRRSGGRIRVTSQLVEAERARHLWADRYDAAAADPFQAEDEISRRIVQAAAAALRDAERERSGGGELSAAPDAGPPAAPERRQVTVLSSELVGASTPGVHADLDDLREITAAWRGSVAQAAERFGGCIAQTIGNTAMIVFGYPAAQEDDAERAIRAGLELCRQAGASEHRNGMALGCRAGIATGLVIIGADDSAGGPPPSGMIGAIPDSAERLRSLARAGGVVVDSATRRIVGRLFEFGDVDAAGMEGGSEVLGAGAAISRFEALRDTALTPLVGREEELELLLRRWRKSRKYGGKVVLVSGEPGIGKSRLVLALQERLLAESHLRLRFFCAPHRADTALFPFLAQLERRAWFDRGDGVREKLDKIGALLARTNVDVPHAAALLGDLLSLPADERHPMPELGPQKRKERTLAALLALFEGLARERPLLMVFEDLHWIDPTSLELLALLVERVPSLPVLVLMTFRPEFQAPWIGQSHVTLLSLSRLEPHDRAELVRQVAAERTLSGGTVAAIVERTDGVPLFVEELTKAVLETEAEPSAIGIPATLHASLLARLDRLGPAREIAQIGAAIGREFSHELIAAVAGRGEAELEGALKRLVDSALVFRRGAGPEATYLFKHALVQDAAYGVLLRDARRDLHARIATTLMAQFPDVAEMTPEVLAHHHAAAGRPSDAAVFWGRAGRRSIARSALVEGVAQLTRALEQIVLAPMTAALRRERIDLQIALANALMHVKGYASPDAIAAFEAARRMIDDAEAQGEAPDDPLLRYSLMYGLWSTSFVNGCSETPPPIAAEFLERAQQSAASGPLLVAHRLLGTSLLLLGRPDSARGHFDRAVALYDPAEHGALATRFAQDVGVAALAHRAWTLWLLGHPDAALDDLAAMHARARACGQAITLMYALAHGTVPEVLAGRLPEAMEHAEELIAIAEEKGGPTWMGFGQILLGWAASLTGEPARGVRLIEAGLASWKEGWLSVYLPMFLAAAAGAHAAAGATAEAAAAITQALDHVEKTGKRWPEAELHRVAGLLALPGDAARAEACFERSLMVARRQKARAWELRAATSLARLRLDQGRAREAHGILAPVVGSFMERGATPDLDAANALLRELAAQAEPPRRRSRT